MDTFRGLMNMRRNPYNPRSWGSFQRKKRPNTIPPGLVPRMPTAPYQGMEPTATLNSAAMPKKKGFFGNIMGKLNEMTEEEKKDFREVLQEGDFRIDQEFLAGGNYGRTQEYAHQPFLFDESTAAEYQRRRKLNPYV